jgi:type IV secretion system protein VirB10
VTGNGPNESVGPVSGPTPSSDDSVQALRLRADHPRITRLSRKVLAGGTSLALLLISGAVLWALRSNHPHNPAPDELYSTDHHSVADGLTTLPQDYAGLPRDVPRLGPPLPGDLGRPIGTVEGQSVPIGLDAEQQRANQETEAARTSKVFASTVAPVTPPHAASPEMTTNTASSSDEHSERAGSQTSLRQCPG